MNIFGFVEFCMDPKLYKKFVNGITWVIICILWVMIFQKDLFTKEFNFVRFKEIIKRS
jgi:hypothetical protein